MEVADVGLTRALFHRAWCPLAPVNHGKLVHERPINNFREEKERCGGAISKHASGLYVCERCNARARRIEEI